MSAATKTKRAPEPGKAPVDAEELVEGSSLTADAMRRFKRNRMAMACLTAVTIVTLLSFLPWAASFVSTDLGNAYITQDLTQTDMAPMPGLGFSEAFGEAGRGQSLGWKIGRCGRYLMGTDANGRSVFWRVLEGGRISFLVAFIGTLVSLIVGVTYGSIAGYAGGRIDNLMMRGVDVLYGLPFMFLVIVFMSVIRGVTQELWPIFIALGLVQWLTMARITRGQVISLRGQEFISAARVLGAPPSRILAFHVIPNLLGPIIIYTTLTIPGTMLQESFLSFLGLGIREPQCSWGSLAADGIQALSAVHSHWWQIFFPCLALAITLFSLNFIGDGLRDALDPKGQK